MSINYSTRYPGRVGAADADYPTGTPINATTPGTGTPLDQFWVQDMVGARDAILGATGITANNNPDTAQSSQLLQGLNGLYTPQVIPSGTMVTATITTTQPMGGRTALVAGLTVVVRMTNQNRTNRSASALNVTPVGGSALGPVSILDRRGRTMPVDFFQTGQVYRFMFNGTAWVAIDHEIVNIRQINLEGQVTDVPQVTDDIVFVQANGTQSGPERSQRIEVNDALLANNPGMEVLYTLEARAHRRSLFLTNASGSTASIHGIDLFSAIQAGPTANNLTLTHNYVSYIKIYADSANNRWIITGGDTFSSSQS